ncbi:hypothetical protein LEP1GSC062_2546 [Leptospira alexanderi serovar Manhao 3 str. L 60]|uniref:Uncharacterized protein n=1 Tax=Leptospira alexanderi serovar Manhao 3 str. L 60 TaxID=1049759 RepID=V6I032_9LEPT|nr:hypothetical protein LEP1GSC062_2546 [Leptospira alexanderi serovar Manhao 3 str. L 60]
MILPTQKESKIVLINAIRKKNSYGFFGNSMTDSTGFFLFRFVLWLSRKFHWTYLFGL